MIKDRTYEQLLMEREKNKGLNTHYTNRFKVNSKLANFKPLRTS